MVYIVELYCLIVVSSDLAMASQKPNQVIVQDILFHNDELTAYVNTVVAALLQFYMTL